MGLRRAPLICLLGLDILTSRAADATETVVSEPSTANSGPTSAELLSVLEREAGRARTWRYGWTGANVVLGVGGFALIPFIPSARRPALVLGGAASVVNAAITWFWPFEVESAADSARGLPAGDAATRQRELDLVSVSAADERARRAWPWHLANLAEALGLGAIVAFGYRQTADAAIGASSSFVLGEVQILTQPARLSGSFSADTSDPIARRGALLSWSGAW